MKCEYGWESQRDICRLEEKRRKGLRNRRGKMAVAYFTDASEAVKEPDFILTLKAPFLPPFHPHHMHRRRKKLRRISQEVKSVSRLHDPQAQLVVKAKANMFCGLKAAGDGPMRRL
jgi:hypothetical protein